MSEFVFKRYEIKYILTPEQYSAVLEDISPYMKMDKYGESTIQSLYYDTPDYLLIRRSIEKPEYKEKLRVRSYGIAGEDDKVYLEIKKKAYGVVFKRRISMPHKDAKAFFTEGLKSDKGQIGKELEYCRKFYKDLAPAMLILYDRTAYYQDNTELRMTFDRNVRYRKDRLNLSSGLDGIHLLDGGKIMWEIKSPVDAFPLWLVKILSKHKLYKASFSKYGTAYTREILKKNNLEEEESV
jgi:hypothetical protein